MANHLVCRKCGGKLANIGTNGMLILGGMYARMAVVECPACKTLTIYPNVMQVLNLGTVDVDAIAQALEQVQGYGEGWGKIVIEYRDGQVFGIGMDITRMTHERKAKIAVESEQKTEL